MNKSDANLAGLQSVNVIRKSTVTGTRVKIPKVKYPNCILEQAIV